MNGGAPDLPLGARPLPGGRASFRVWAPHAERVELLLESDDARTLPMHAHERGYHTLVAENVPADARYRFRLDGGAPLPDPASRRQPEGVHGPSALYGDAFRWTDDDWRPPRLRDWVIYELHVGTFTPEATFEAVIPRLDALAELGVTTLELMPVAAFPGTRNWGYDGVHPCAVQESYGGPDGLKRLVDAAHARGLAVLLDVVYNHLGPEGNYLGAYGPYFTDIYHTPWGAALNFDERGSDGVRDYFVQNACQWVGEFHLDGLRLDAVHAILDRSARPFLAELAARTRARAAADGRPTVLIAESDLGDPRVVHPPHAGGWGMDAHWLDDFHHALHALLTGERRGYYADFGGLADLGEAYRRGYVYTGQYSLFRDRRHGAPPRGVSPEALVVYAQNHDQVGNRPAGDRLAASLTPARLRLAAAAVLLAPFTPMLFMGEEYGETRPFPYFVSHTDAALVKAVREGRRREFAGFFEAADRGGSAPGTDAGSSADGAAPAPGTPATAVPDPQAEATFRSAVPAFEEGYARDPHGLLALHRRLLALRRELPALRPDTLEATEVEVDEAQGVLTVQRSAAGATVRVYLHFADAPATVELPAVPGGWRELLDTAATATAEAPPVRPAGALELDPWSARVLLHEARSP